MDRLEICKKQAVYKHFIHALKRKNIEFPENCKQGCQKAHTEGARSLSKSEKAKLQRLYKEGKAAFGSVRNLQKASSL